MIFVIYFVHIYVVTPYNLSFIHKVQPSTRSFRISQGIAKTSENWQSFPMDYMAFIHCHEIQTPTAWVNGILEICQHVTWVEIIVAQLYNRGKQFMFSSSVFKLKIKLIKQTLTRSIINFQNTDPRKISKFKARFY